jgi:cell volume regulation protein A
LIITPAWVNEGEIDKCLGKFMNAFQPTSLPLLLTIFAILMVASAVLSGASQRAGVPVVLAFLMLGILAGKIGLSQILSQDYRSYFNFGAVALILILFDGGLNTPFALLVRGLAPAALLATVGSREPQR